MKELGATIKTQTEVVSVKKNEDCFIIKSSGAFGVTTFIVWQSILQLALPALAMRLLAISNIRFRLEAAEPTTDFLGYKEFPFKTSLSYDNMSSL